MAVYIPVIRAVQACRDTRDDKFLSVAINGGADAIISGDKDLLSLNPFLEIPILTPAEFLRLDFSA